MRSSFAATSPAFLALLPLLAVHCIGAEPAVVDGGSATDTGVTHPKVEAGRDGGLDAKTRSDAGLDATKDVTIPSDATSDSVAPPDTGHDAGVDSGHDAGIDAVGICNSGLAESDAAPPGSVNGTFAGGDKGSIGAATPEDMLIDHAGNIYVIGVRTNCVGPNTGADVAVTRFLPTGLLDDTFGAGPDDAGAGGPGNGTVCFDFDGGADIALGGAFDSSGKLVVTGYAATAGDAATTPLSTVLALARILPSGALDHTFGTHGKVRVNPAAPYGTCGTGATCSPPQAQEGEAVAITPSGLIFVVGTTGAYPAVGNADNAGFIAAFNSDGSAYQSFNQSGAFPGYVVDSTLEDLNDIAVDGSTLVVTGTTLGTGDGGTAGYKNRKIVTRRYLTTGALDTSFNASGAGGAVAGEVLASPGTNDYGLSVRVQPDGSILVVGIASVGGPATNASIYAPGYMTVLRYTSTGALDTTFGGSEDDAGAPGMFVSRSLESYPAYSHFQLALECDNQPVVSGFVLVNGFQSPAAVRLTTSGQLDTRFGEATDGGGLANVVFSGKNVVGGAIGIDSNHNILVVGGDNSGNPVLELFNR